MPAERKPIVMQTKKSNVIYENWKVYSCHGKLMFRCNEKKAKWYLKRDLGKLLPHQGERSIELTFDAKGEGHSEGDYMIEDRINTCVACNTNELLTMHHVVPELYRRAMPLCIKSKSSRDILLLCKQCHHLYEDEAMQLKKQIAQQYDCPLEGKGWIRSVEKRKVRKAAAALLRFKDKIPKDRQDELIQTVKAYQQLISSSSSSRSPMAAATATIKPACSAACVSSPLSLPSPHPSEKEIEQQESEQSQSQWTRLLEEYSQLEDVYHGPDFIEHGTCVIQQLMAKEHMTTENGHERWPELETFIKLWRQHFLTHIKPKYLSPRWTVDGEIYNY